MLLKLRTTPSVPSFGLSQSHTFPRPGDISSDVELPICIGLLYNSVISSQLLDKWTSAALLTSQATVLGPLIAKIFGCYALWFGGSIVVLLLVD